MEEASKQKEYEEAFLWLKRSANLDFSPAQNSLGLLYDYGKGCDRNPLLALEFYQRAGDHEQALFNLGMLYFLGDGIDRDEQMAFSCFQRSAKENETRA